LLHLKRFNVERKISPSHQGNNDENSHPNSPQAKLQAPSYEVVVTKNNAPVAISTSLSLGSNDNKEGKFVVQAVVHHIGNTATRGHYKTDAIRDAKWVRFDDAKVKTLSDDIINETESKEQVYMLLYVRKDLALLPAKSPPECQTKGNETGRGNGNGGQGNGNGGQGNGLPSWKTTPPQEGASEYMTKFDRPYMWCKTCTSWNLSHVTAGHEVGRGRHGPAPAATAPAATAPAPAPAPAPGPPVSATATANTVASMVGDLSLVQYGGFTCIPDTENAWYDADDGSSSSSGSIPLKD
jgi:hypothetical protein